MMCLLLNVEFLRGGIPSSHLTQAQGLAQEVLTAVAALQASSRVCWVFHPKGIYSLSAVGDQPFICKKEPCTAISSPIHPSPVPLLHSPLTCWALMPPGLCRSQGHQRAWFTSPASEELPEQWDRRRRDTHELEHITSHGPYVQTTQMALTSCRVRRAGFPNSPPGWLACR